MTTLVTIMDEFLEFLRQRKVQLKKELAELEVAERVYLSSGARLASGQQSLSLVEPVRSRKTIKEMILEVLRQIEPRGATALEILDLIRAQWKPDLERTTLSPQLTRLRKRNEIHNDRGVWKLGKPQGEDLSEEIGSSPESIRPKTDDRGGSSID